jgi:hypothetical protein
MEDREDAYREKVLDVFFKDSYCEQLPVQQKKRLIILEEIAKAFNDNVTYDELEVNEIIKDYHDDYCTVRRELVDFKFLSRTKGHYQKR